MQNVQTILNVKMKNIKRCKICKRKYTKSVQSKSMTSWADYHAALQSWCGHVCSQPESLMNWDVTRQDGGEIADGRIQVLLHFPRSSLNEWVCSEGFISKPKSYYVRLFSPLYVIHVMSLLLHIMSLLSHLFFSKFWVYYVILCQIYENSYNFNYIN